jgi:hypothetical protein
LAVITLRVSLKARAVSAQKKGCDRTAKGGRIVDMNRKVDAMQTYTNVYDVGGIKNHEALPSIVTSALQMATANFPETLASTYRSTRRQIPKHHYHRPL